MKKVVVINPRGIKGDEEYLHGFMVALNELEDIDASLYTNYYYEKNDEEINYKCKGLFFRYSEKMSDGLFRKIVRVLEYVFQYVYVIKEIKHQQPDVVHIHWSVISKIDHLFFKRIKKICGKIVFTAHNVLPHIQSEKYIESYGKIYQTVDCVVVHGESIYSEFIKYYPELSKKVIISRHGKKEASKIAVDYNDLEVKQYSKVVGSFDRVLLCFGMVYYEKGLDRVIKYWEKNPEHNNSLLIVAGKSQPTYEELNNLRDYANSAQDILFLDQFLSNNLLAYFLSKADLIILPYRHASMSGVMLTAAAEEIAVLCTNVGALSEYLSNDCGWIVDNNDETLFAQIEDIIINYSKEDLRQIGCRFGEYVNSKYNWSNIIKELYSKICNR